MTTVHRPKLRPGEAPAAAPGAGVPRSPSAPPAPQAGPQSGGESSSAAAGPRRIAHLASEMAPFVKVGGLADVVGALSAEQARRGHRVLVVLPAYRDLNLPSGAVTRPLGSADVTWGLATEPAEFALIEPPGGGPRVLLVRHIGPRAFFDRPGIYDDPRTGEGYADNSERFLFFCRAALEGLARVGEPIDVLHAHDHQAAWAPCFVRAHPAMVPRFGDVATVFTIHNLGYQGITDPWVLGLAGFGPDVFYAGGPFEYWGRVNFMKVGLAFADMLSTVSPRYAREIQTSGEFGFGLEGVLQKRGSDLRGILNGIDDQYWNPATDPYLPRPYDASTLERKADDRTALAAECGFAAQKGDWPLIGMVTRLVEQKGMDLIEQAQHELMRLEARWVVLGDGQPRYVEMMRRLAANFPERFYYRGGFDEPLAHRIEAGCDLFLMPSRYEPCGLNQMYSLRYGTPPVVRAVGGLADSVQEFDPLTRRGTGFAFTAFEPAEMVGALRHALAIFRQPELWRALQRNGMACDFSWRRSADGYDQLYADAVQRVASGRVMTLESVRGRI
jgi:starch synthase